jgi:Flp pilus assembly protein TadG
MALAKTRFGNPSGRRRQSGTAAIEFGLFIPFLLILFTGTVELGFAMYESMQVNNAVEAGMLYAAKNGWDLTVDPTGTAIKNAVVNASSVYPGVDTPALTATPAPSQFCGCPTATGITNLGTQPPCSATACSGLHAGTYVQVNAALNHLTILPGSGLVLPATLTATAVLRIN